MLICGVSSDHHQVILGGLEVARKVLWFTIADERGRTGELDGMPGVGSVWR